MRGMSCDMSAIIRVANRHGIKVVEDVAQANGGMSDGRMLGSIGDVGCFSLQQSKVITTGEGGMVVTDDENIWQRATMFHDCAMYPFRFTEMKIPSFAGQNYRLTELQAALCLGQIGRMPSILSRTTKTKERLVQRLKSVTQIRFSDSFGTERDLGISLVFYVQDAKTALYFSEALTCEGVPAQPLYDQSQKDLHVVVNWEFLMKRQDAWGGHYPWDQEFYKGSVQYAPELWQDSLDILSSAVQIRLNQLIEDEDCDDICAAVEKVAHYLEQVGGLNG